MKIHSKIRLSSELIFTKTVCFFLMLFSLKLLIERRNNTDSGFIDNIELKGLFLISCGSLLYFFMRPKIYYDQVNLYIKKINTSEVVVPLKNIKSFFLNPLSVDKGTATVSIEFTDILNEENSIKFTATYSSQRIENFKILIQRLNPNVEVI